VGSREDVMAALHDASDRFIELAAAITPAEAKRPVPWLDWTVGETVAHVLTVIRRGYADPRRSASAAQTADLNQICVDETPERDPAALADLLRSDVHTALDLGELIGAWLKPGVADEQYELRLGDERPISFGIKDGRLVVGAGGGGDVIAASPLDMVLTFYGRISTNDPLLIRLLSRFVPS
jgi:hypothetical protein